MVIDKTQQLSDWGAKQLSSAQLAYAAGDVWYLDALMTRLRNKLEKVDRWQLAERCFAHLPARVDLEIQGFDDVFVY